jgi:ribosomal-protein-serine acetyltransferase
VRNGKLPYCGKEANQETYISVEAAIRCMKLETGYLVCKQCTEKISSLLEDPPANLVSIHTAFSRSLFDIVNTNREYLRKYLPWVDKIKSLADEEWFINNTKDISFVIMDEKRNVAGFCSARNIDGITKAIGYWLSPQKQGKGLATKAIRELINSLFQGENSLRRVEIRTAVFNEASKKLAERLGFTKEGILRQTEYLNGEYVDQELYSVLRDEWFSKQKISP